MSCNENNGSSNQSGVKRGFTDEAALLSSAEGQNSNPQTESSHGPSSQSQFVLGATNPVGLTSSTERLAGGSGRYEDALAYLYGRLNYEKNTDVPYGATHYRLDRMRRMADVCGNPQNCYPIIHVAGTKGKGTVCHLLGNCLTASGFRTGVYSSPHLIHLEERFRCDGETATRHEIVALVDTVAEVAEQVAREGLGNPTFFELTTLMAFEFFRLRAVECVVLEVGLGGRLDSTNICQPILSIITSISMDHQRQLGTTIGAIAREKAGIIKSAIPVICSASHPEARPVVEQTAAEHGSVCQILGRDFQIRWEPEFGEPQCRNASFEYNSPRQQLRGDTVMLGKHQADNIATVLAAAETLQDLGWEIDYRTWGAALAKANPPARMQVVGTEPVQIIDTAHNPASIRAGIDALRDHFGDRSFVAVLAFSRDKDYRSIVKQFLPVCRRLILCNFLGNPRALPATKLNEVAEELILSSGSSCMLQIVPDPWQAWQQAVASCEPTDVVYAAGSFFLAGELLQCLE